MTPGFDAFETIVRDLWPSYRASVQPMWDTRLYRYPIDTLGAVLRQYRADHPDDTKPHWSTIYGILAGGGTRVGKSDLQILLNSVRRAIRSDPGWMKRKPIDAWTDADVLENHIEANVGPILRNMGGTTCDDPDGRLARLAVFTRMAIVQPLITDLEQRGDPVPEWLTR